MAKRDGDNGLESARGGEAGIRDGETGGEESRYLVAIRDGEEG